MFLCKKSRALFSLSFIRKNTIQIISTVLAVLFVLLVALFVETKRNTSYLEDLQDSVDHFHKVATFFTKRSYQDEKDIEQNLNHFRNIVFWNTKNFRHENASPSFPVVVTRAGINIEDKRFMHIDLSKSQSIQGNKLILRFSFPQDLYFLIVPLEIKKGMFLKIDHNGHLKVVLSLQSFFSCYLLLLVMVSLFVFFSVSKMKRYFESKGRGTFLSLHRKTMRRAEVLEQKNKSLQSKVYCLQSTLSCFKDKIFESAKDYLNVSEKSITLFKEFQDSQTEKDVPLGQKSDYLMIYDVFRKEKVKLSCVLEEVLKILGDVLIEKGIKISIEPMLGKTCFYGDKEVILSSLYLVLQTVCYSHPAGGSPIKMTGDVKGGRLTIAFFGADLSSKAMTRNTYHHLFSVKKGTGLHFRITFEPFIENKKKAIKPSVQRDAPSNVVTLFKKN